MDSLGRTVFQVLKQCQVRMVCGEVILVGQYDSVEVFAHIAYTSKYDCSDLFQLPVLWGWLFGLGV